MGHGLRRGWGAYGCKGLGPGYEEDKDGKRDGDGYILRTWGAAVLRPYKVDGEC